jgi:WD40 repeat protein
MKHRNPLKLLCSYRTQFSQTGSLLVTISRDIVVWDVERRTKRYRVHPLSHPSHCSIHPNETHIVVKSTAGTIALLDALDGALVCFLDPTKHNVGSNIVYSSCGEYLVDGSWNGHLTVRCARSGKVVFQKTFPGEMIKKVAFSDQDGKWFVVHQPRATSHDLPPAPAYVSVWAWPFDSPVDILMPSEAWLNEIAVSPDGKRMGFIGHNTISVMDLAEKQFSASIPFRYAGGGFALSWSPDSREFSTIQKNSVVFYDATTLVERMSVEVQFASDIAYSPDGSLVALGAWEAGMLIERAKASSGV